MSTLGEFRMSPTGTVTAGRPQVFTLTYEVGSAGLASGDVVEFAFPPLWIWQKGQIEDDRREDYISVEVSRDGVRFLRRLYCWRQQHRPAVEVEIVGDVGLQGGDTVTVLYGKETPEQSGVRVDRWASITPFANRFARFQCVIHRSGRDEEEPVPPSPITLDIVPDAPEKVIARVPSIAKAGEAITLKAALVDKHHNAIRYQPARFVGKGADDVLPEAAIAPEQGGKLCAGRVDVRAGEPGVARIEVVEERTGIVGRTNPVKIEHDPKTFIFWGDIHGHANASDGVVSIEDYYTYARDAAMLDFTSLTEHDPLMKMPDGSRAPWDDLCEACERFNAPGAFATLHGYEWTCQTYGHRNVYFRTDRAASFRWLDEASDSPAKLWACLEGCDAIVVPHHPTGLWFTNPMKGLAVNDWSRGHDKECLVEIFSNWGNSERIGDPDNFTILQSGGHFVQDALDMGRRVGFIASSDSHNGHPGLTGLFDMAEYDPGLVLERFKHSFIDPRRQRTSPDKMRGCLVAVLAEELTREAVFDALAARRCYATTGTRPIVTFTVNDAPMGSVITPTPERHIEAHVIAGQPIRTIELWRNDAVIAATEPDADEGGLAFKDKNAVPSGTFYYLRVIEQSGDKAWASPVWVG